ncbi:MAG: type II toxin-antitoxin system RelE/ParE family toxin [Campylobacterota bacterium]|nr:type II toxin-antitoxin system RelE/ParE family toxin [Campylobacterota bacterium]
MKYDIKQTDIFSKWLLKLKDIKGKVSIIRRVDRMRKGNFGDHKGLGDEVSELRISIGAGYRVYYTIQDKEVVLLLVGGDKSTQKADIQKAKNLVKELKDDK